jgi:mannose-6-phosphate isomerase-like protein (cupin superfamily)
MTLLGPGEGRKIVTPAQEVTFKVTGADGSPFSLFEVVVPAGFDVGAHVHENSQEMFYVLSGELDLMAFDPVDPTGDSWQDWKSEQGEQVVRAGAGSCLFVPSGKPHAFRNGTSEPVRMLFLNSPSPHHERYFEEIAEIWAAGSDPEAVRRMRSRYDLRQLTPLRYEPPQGG